MSHGRRSLLPSAILVLLALSALHAQMLNPIPGSVQDVAGQFPLTDEFSFEQQIQVGTQGNSGNGNPFAYGHGLQVQPWFHYDGVRNTTLSGSAIYIAYFNVPGTSNYAHPEWRVTALGTLKQPLSEGSVYEQTRFELLNFRDSHAVTRHLPRVRLRFGQDLYLGEGNSKPYLGIYEEAIVQFPQPSYSHVNFEGARFFAGYGFDCGARTQVLLGFKAEAEVSSSGSTVTLYYGPAFSIEYNFTSHTLNEKHKRTTAFKDF
jgi:hypothetical protein